MSDRHPEQWDATPAPSSAESGSPWDRPESGERGRKDPYGNGRSGAPSAHGSPAPDQPGFGSPSSEPSGYGTPAQGQPTQGSPGYGQAGYGTPAYGQPAYGTPAYGQPAYGTPAHGQPAYGQQPYGGPGYGYGYGPAPTNTMAILALVFAFVFAPVAIVLGVMARKEIARTGEQGHGLATAGMWLGIAFTALFVLAFLIPLLFVIIGGLAAAGGASGGI